MLELGAIDRSRAIPYADGDIPLPQKFEDKYIFMLDFDLRQEYEDFMEVFTYLSNNSTPLPKKLVDLGLLRRECRGNYKTRWWISEEVADDVREALPAIKEVGLDKEEALKRCEDALEKMTEKIPVKEYKEEPEKFEICPYCKNIFSLERKETFNRYAKAIRLFDKLEQKLLEIEELIEKVEKMENF